MDMTVFGSRLKALRTERKLTQEQLAEKFNISSRSVSRWETGVTMPDIELLLELSDFYQVDIRDLLNTEKESEKKKMEEEEKDTVLAVAEYKDEMQKRFIRKVVITLSAGVVTAFCGLIMVMAGMQTTLQKYLYGLCAGITLGALIIALLYILNVKPHKKKKWGIPRVIISALILIIAGVHAVLQDTHAFNTVLKAEFERDVRITEGKADTDSFEIPFSVDESGSYSFNLNLKGKDEGFISGIVLEEEAGTAVIAFTVGNGSCTFDSLSLKEGNYTVHFTVLESQEELQAFLQTYDLTEGSNKTEFTFRDGTFTGKYKITVVKK